jgi:exopolysaccharide biosynthesis polyprenyl glycosylphosphotransferase
LTFDDFLSLPAPGRVERCARTPAGLEECPLSVHPSTLRDDHEQWCHDVADGPRSLPPSPVVEYDDQQYVVSNLRRILFALDMLALAIAWVPSLMLGLDRTETLLMRCSMTLFAIVVSILVLSLNELYLSRVASVRTIEVARIIRSVTIVSVVLMATFRIVHVDEGLIWIVVGGMTMALALLATRSGYRAWLASARARGFHQRRVIVIGGNAEAAELVKMLDEHPDEGFRVCGVVTDREVAESHGIGGVWLGPRHDLDEILRRERVNGVVIVTAELEVDELEKLISRLQKRGVHIQLSSGVLGIHHRRLRAAPIAYQPIYYLEAPGLNSSQVAVKRVIDLIVASLLLVVALPVMLVIAALVKLGDRGPVFFKQVRVGRHGESFGLLKFRTMVPNAEARLKELQAHNERVGPLFKMDHDPRITRVGRFLRLTSLDELPQLINVLKGEMSLVGPRPALPSEVEQFDEKLMARMRVPPGITGLWQVEARDNPNFGAYRRLDLFYVENWTLSLDLVILLATVEQVIAKAVRSVFGRRHADEPVEAGVAAAGDGTGSIRSPYETQRAS